MRISDWSSDVCSSDLFGAFPIRCPAEVWREIHADVCGDYRFKAASSPRDFASKKSMLPSPRRRPFNDRAFSSGLIVFWLVPTGNSQCAVRSEEHTSELQSLMRISYAVFCLTKKKINQQHTTQNT